MLFSFIYSIPSQNEFINERQSGCYQVDEDGKFTETSGDEINFLSFPVFSKSPTTCINSLLS